MNIVTVFLMVYNSRLRQAVASLLITGGLLLSACVALPSEQDRSLRETQLELNVAETLAAQQATEANLGNSLQAQQATLGTQLTQVAQVNEPPPATQTPDPAEIIEQTVQAQQNQTSPTAPIATSEPTTPSKEPFEDWIKNAQILLYEDMTAQLDTNRYVKDALDSLGLPYTDVGSAKGWLQSQVASNAPNGQSWDLVIMANESKRFGASGEFFTYALDLLDQQISVIMEVWWIDKVSSGAAAPLLVRCGLAHEKNWTNVPPSRLVMFPLSTSNPIMFQPNSSLTFTAVTSFWWNPEQDIDIGDWMKLISGGDAELLVGTIASDTTTHGTVATCFAGQFILQTFSSHQLTFTAMKPVWENYIYNALKARYDR